MSHDNTPTCSAKAQPNVKELKVSKSPYGAGRDRHYPRRHCFEIRTSPLWWARHLLSREAAAHHSAAYWSKLTTRGASCRAAGSFGDFTDSGGADDSWLFWCGSSRGHESDLPYEYPALFHSIRRLAFTRDLVFAKATDNSAEGESREREQFRAPVYPAPKRVRRTTKGVRINLTVSSAPWVGGKSIIACTSGAASTITHAGRHHCRAGDAC